MKEKLLILLFLVCALPGYSQESQNEVAAAFESGNYSVYKLTEQNKFEKVSKTWPIEINKSGTTILSVLVKRSGILDELFEADVPGYPSHFLFKNFRLTFQKNYIAYHEWNAKQQATTKFVFVKEGESFSETIETVNKTIQDYAVATFKNQSTAKVTLKEDKAKQIELDRKLNSLEGKEVASIEIKLVEQPDQIAHYGKSISYGIIAILKNGDKLSTPNLGGKLPWSDFILNHEGCSNLPEIVDVETDAQKIPNDVITFNATSMFHKQLKASKSITATFDVGIHVNKNGFNGFERSTKEVVFQGVDGQHAGNADNMTIKVVTVKHKKTGEPLNKIEISCSDGKIIRYKLAPSTELIINANGGRGMDGRKGYKGKTIGGNGGNGGRGGNVTVISDPSVSAFNVVINVEGGKGGNGGAPDISTGVKGNTGNQGSQGSIIKQTQKVNLNF